MKYLLLFAIIIPSLQSRAQCRSGNCVNGKGIYDFGWCVYTGEFRYGKPEGQGSMKYDDYTYTGHFKNGLEDGDGEEVTKDGKRGPVHYSAGKKQAFALVHVDAKDYKPLQAQDAGCKDGDCITGFGTYQFPSGNKYVGNFKNKKREGQGTFFFSNGDTFEGTFLDNFQYSGTYTYSSGAKYVGTYYAGGQEYNGTIYSPSGKSIPYVNGKPVMPPPSPAENEHYGICSCCHGHGTIVNHSYGSVLYQANDHYHQDFYTMYRDVTCNCCHGTGAASDQQPGVKADRFDNRYHVDVIH